MIKWIKRLFKPKMENETIMFDRDKAIAFLLRKSYEESGSNFDLFEWVRVNGLELE